MPENDRSRWFLALMVAGIVSAVLTAGCGSEIEDGSQFAGQRCLQTSDCVQGLVCSERRCVPVTHPTADVTADVGPTDTATDGGDTVDCEVGTRSCVDESRVRICRSGGPVVRECRGDVRMVCRNGQCVPDRPCQDEDGDKHGKFCAAGSDCDDSDPNVHSGMSEQCDTPIDDDCDGEINENCTECCAGSCGRGSFCDACSCTSYSRTRCEYQLQPCRRGAGGDGFICRTLGEDRPRCLEICDRTSADPTADCSTPNSACAFELGRSRGICMTGCSLQQGCGIQGYGCLPYEGPREGICAPVNSNNEVGESCDEDDSFDCEAGALCTDGDGGGQGTCREACRPYAEPNATDCPSGQKCFPVSDRVGVCRPDNGASRGDSCNRDGETCSRDAVACLPAGAGGTLQCQRICRLDEGDTDCSGGRRCRDLGGEIDDELGLCR